MADKHQSKYLDKHRKKGYKTARSQQLAMARTKSKKKSDDTMDDASATPSTSSRKMYSFKRKREEKDIGKYNETG